MNIDKAGSDKHLPDKNVAPDDAITAKEQDGQHGHRSVAVGAQPRGALRHGDHPVQPNEYAPPSRSVEERSVDILSENDLKLQKELKALINTSDSERRGKLEPFCVEHLEWIKKHPDCLLYSDALKSTLVHQICRTNNVDMLRAMLETAQGQQALSIQDIYERMPLHWAAMKSDGCLDYLVTHYPDHEALKHRDAFQQVPLHCAVVRGRLSACREMIRQAPETLICFNTVFVSPFSMLIDIYNKAFDQGDSDPAVAAIKAELEELLDLALSHPFIAEQLSVIDGLQYISTTIDPEMNAKIAALKSQYAPAFKPVAFDYAAARQQPDDLLEGRASAALDLARQQRAAPPVTYSTSHQAEALSLASGDGARDRAETKARQLVKGLGCVGVYGRFTAYAVEKEHDFWSLGDETASMQLVHQLVSLECPRVVCRLSPPRDATADKMDFAARKAHLEWSDMREREQRQQQIALHKLAFLMPECDPRKGLPQTVKVGSSEVTFIRYDDPTGSPALEVGFIEGIIRYMDTGTLADNYMNLKPYRFGSPVQSLITDVESTDAGVKINRHSLDLPVNSLLSEATIGSGRHQPGDIREREALEIAYKSAGVKNPQVVKNLASASQQMREGVLSGNMVYGLHHPEVPVGRVASRWMKLLSAKAAASASGRPIIVLLNEVSVQMHSSKQTLESMGIPVIYATSNAAEGQLNQLKKDGGVAVYVLPTVPKPVFDHLMESCDLPTLTEGANTTSHLLEKGMPYLSLLPGGRTPVPQEMGYPLEALKAEAFAYKLHMTTEHKEGLEQLHKFIREGNYHEASAFINNNAGRLEAMEYLFAPLKECDVTAGVRILNVPYLLSKGEQGQLGDLEKKALLAAADPSDEAFLEYVNSMMDETTPTHDHFAMQQVHVGQGFNNTLISALNRFAGLKKLI